MVRFALLALLLVPLSIPLSIAARQTDFTMAQVLDYPYATELAAAERGDVIAWVVNVAGVRNVWIAHGPQFTPVQLTRYTQDDGQEITHLTFSPDGNHLVYVRGGDHDANWPAEGHLAPDPADSAVQPTMAIWTIPLAGGTPLKLADGDGPAISARGQLAFLKDDRVWTVPLDGTGKIEPLFFDRGKDSDLRWSPDGSRLAFVSGRGDHSLIGIFRSSSQPLIYLAPSTGHDLSPRWSRDGIRIAFVRRPGEGGPPEPILKQIAHPWAIWVANVDDGSAHRLWQSPKTLAGSFPEVEGEANLHWAAGERIVFLAYLDDWPHLYCVPVDGGAVTLLTPGAFMVEHVTQSRDQRWMIYDANTGSDPSDLDRRHLFRVPVDRAAPVALTSGNSLEWTPVAATSDRIAFVASGVQAPPAVALVGLDGHHRKSLDAGPMPADFPLTRLIEPEPVTFQAPDGITVHGQLFDVQDHGRQRAGGARMPAIIFVHGGPPRQMLLGWHYMEYYSNAYAVNQYLARHGFIVLSVNYRLGIGYGRAFHQPEHAGPTGASEYQDVLAAARYLQSRPDVDAHRIGIWGGSYGGFLTALALARNSDVFKAGVDLHGVHDWSRLLDDWVDSKPVARYEKGDREAAMKVAWESSPDSSIDTWKSPVLLIQGDDDRNVPFAQTVDLARRLQSHEVSFEEIVLPNEIHGFLLHSSWQRVDEATAGYFARILAVDPRMTDAR